MEHLSLVTARWRLLNHAIYREVDTVEKLRAFMEDHVFAVWDFMSLLKRLQRELTSVELPWQAPQDATMARFINEIVLSEESDVGHDAIPRSHLELYLAGMHEVGADTRRFEEFAALVASGSAPSDALREVDAPHHVRSFVLDTLDCALYGQTVEVIAFFLYGREDVIPDMFQRLLSHWDGARDQVASFAYYLERHIELDGDEHGPAGHRLLERYAKTKADWHMAARAARRAIDARCSFWDGVLASISQREPRSRICVRTG